MSTDIAPIVGMTNEQAGRAADRFQTFCRKEGTALPKDTVQAVLEEEGEELSADMFAALRARVERRAKMIVRRAKVDRSRTPRQALDATGRNIYFCDDAVLATAPMEGPEEVDVYFFDLDYDPTTAQLVAEYDKRGLKPDFAAQAAVNEADTAFADERPNGLQWDLQENGVASYAAFDRWGGGREARVYRDDDGWSRCCRFGGVRK